MITLDMSAFASISPKDVVVANCLPLSKQAFLMQKEASIERHEYAKSYYNWGCYYQAIGDLLTFTLNEFEKLGVRVINELTIPQWKNIFLNRVSVVLLVAHWQDNNTENGSCIEFSDGFARVEELVNYIPHDQQMILDLCVCHPTPFVELINKLRPEVRIAYRDVNILPHRWLLIYWKAFSELALNPTDYATALERAIVEIIREN